MTAPRRGMPPLRVQVLAGHSAEVTALHLCHTGRYILSSSTDATCHLWDLHSQVVDLPVPHRGGIRVCPCIAPACNAASPRGGPHPITEW